MAVHSVEPPDNSAQVALIDGRPYGLLALLEEEAFVPGGTHAITLTVTVTVRYCPLPKGKGTGWVRCIF